MAAVFPEEMDRLNVQDVAGCLSKLEGHIRYMHERIEFNSKNTVRSVSEAGVSSTELYMVVIAMQNSLSALSSTVQGLSGSMTALQAAFAALEARVGALEAGAAPAN